jgi:hypothetical protein
MYKLHPEREYARRQRYIEKYPERVKANRKVRYAILKGELTKQPCQVCDAIKVIAHHKDYTKPLDVIWLCELHHKELHNA